MSGPDKDSDKRQRTAIGAFAKRAGFTIVEEYYESYKRDLFLIRQQQSCRFFCWAMCLGSYSRRPALKLWSLR